jgi:hypothetical protein
MHINVWVLANGFTSIIVTYDKTVDIEIQEQADGVITFGNYWETYTYLGSSQNGVLF